MEFDKCIFCERELEDYVCDHIVCTEENGERAETKDGLGLNICKKCARRLKHILDALSEKAEVKNGE